MSGPTTLDMLRVHYRPADGLPKQIKQRPASRIDLLSALGLIEVCQTCEGERHYVVQSTRGPLETDTLPCPSCHDGWVVTEEAVEEAASIVWWNAEPNEERRRYTRAALTAVLFGD